MTRKKHLLKICRVNDRQTAAHLVRLEVDLIGFHLIEERHDSVCDQILDTAKFIKGTFRYSGNCILTKSPSIRFIETILKQGAFSYLQMHRRMDHTQMTSIRQICNDTNVKLIAVFDPSKDNASYLDELKSKSDILLFDQSLGGTGRILDHQDLDKYRGHQFLLAGGINAANISERIKLYDPLGFDIQTGVERAKAKKRFSIVRDIKLQLDPGFPSPIGMHRPCEVFVYGTDTPLDSLPGMMSALSDAVDGVHLEHACGNVTEQYQRNSLQHASTLASAAPDIPYDLHICSPVGRLKAILDEYLTRNENLLRVWIMIDDGKHDCLDDASEIVAQLRSRGIRPAVTISADLSIKRFEATLERYVRRNGVSEICITGPKGGKAEATHAHREGRFLSHLHNLSIEEGLNLWCVLDRRLGNGHLNPIPTYATDAVILGSGLINTNDPRLMVERLRTHLIAQRRR